MRADKTTADYSIAYANPGTKVPLPAIDPESRVRRWPSRWLYRLSTTALYLLIAGGMLWSYRLPDLRVGGDLSMVMGIIVEARAGLKEDQFPLRVAPKQWDGLRYPIFQFYGNFPYTVVGSIARYTGDNPYKAWKVAMVLVFLCGGLSMQRLAYYFTRRRGVAVVAAVLFLTAPYQFTDLNARGAFTEQVALNMLPLAIYASYRAFASHRRRYVVLCALLWSLMGMTHNITYEYGVLFCAMLFASYALRWRRLPKRLLRMLIAGVLHGAMIVWYFVPQFVMLKSLPIGREPLNPFEYATLSPIWVLLSPFLTVTPESASAPGLGLQVGWPILAGVVMGLVALIFRRSARRRWDTVLRFTVLFAIAFFVAWSPVDFWSKIPRVLWFAQFPYRLLIFVVMWGSILGAITLAGWFPRRLHWAILILLAENIALASLPFVPLNKPMVPGFIEQQMRKPDVGPATADAYLLTNELVIKSAVIKQASPVMLTWAYAQAALEPLRKGVELGPDRALALAERSKVSFRHGYLSYRVKTTERTLLELPMLYYPNVLDVKDNDVRIPYANIGRFLTVDLPPGEHHLTAKYVGIRWANYVSALAWVGLGAGVITIVILDAVQRRKRRPSI